MVGKAELQLAAATLSSHVSESVTDAFARYGGEYENTRRDDEVDSKDTSNTIVKKPKFHLLIPASKPTVNLCKTILSAAVLNYPPPTLISFGVSGGNERPGKDGTFDFLLGREATEDDLILIVGEDAWFQLPAEVTINRFLHGMGDSNAKLLDIYGTVEVQNSTASKQLQKYTQRVLFGAGRQCSNGPSEPACYSVPESPLPKDIYGDETDKHIEGKYNRPRYMGSSMGMGRVSGLQPIYRYATELPEFDDIGAHGSQYIFSKIFGEQEFARQIYATAHPTPNHSGWRSFFPTQPNTTLSLAMNYEFGIGLDYYSSIFQSMNNSAEDIRFLTFNQALPIASASFLSASTFIFPLSFTPDLLIIPAPFTQHIISTPNPNPPITALDTICLSDNTSWLDIPLATNVIVHGFSIPPSLNFDGSEHEPD